jgi:outer membrane receptor protein involved in Fe transport
MQLQSSQYFAGDEGNDEKPVSGFTVLNLRGSFRLARHFTLFGSVSNVFDRRYATFGTFSQTSEVEFTEAPGASNPRSVSPGEPRRWRIGVRAEI